MKFVNSKTLCQFAAVISLILIFLPAGAQDNQSSEKNAAIVNGVAISMEQYNTELNVQLARVWACLDFLGERDQPVGFPAHRGDHHHNLITLRFPAFYAPGNIPEVSS